MDEAVADQPRESALPKLLNRFVTPEAVYGLVLWAAIVAAVSSEADDEPDPTIVLNENTIPISDSTSTLIWVTMSMIVFWAAHVFAHSVAGHGVRNGKIVNVGQATALAFRHAAGMLYAPILPSIPLLLGAFGVLSDAMAVDLAMWTAVVVLATLGFLAFTARRSTWLIRILGGLGTAAMGLFIIGLNSIMH